MIFEGTLGSMLTARCTVGCAAQIHSFSVNKIRNLDTKETYNYIVITSWEEVHMMTRIVKIGNSRGIRIPKLVLDEIGLDDEVEMEIENNQLVIRPVPSVRQGWAEAFKKMAEKGDDRLLDENMPTQWDKDEWEWS
jgi:antitoxin MazE